MARKREGVVVIEFEATSWNAAMKDLEAARDFYGIQVDVLAGWADAVEFEAWCLRWNVEYWIPPQQAA